LHPMALIMMHVPEWESVIANSSSDYVME